MDTAGAWRPGLMSILVNSAVEMAAAKAAQHRLMRGVWTNVRFGDMRRALAGTTYFVMFDVSWIISAPLLYLT
jgi:hypothetical protein